MLQFQRWKITLILLICFASILFAIPSFLSNSAYEKFNKYIPVGKINLGLDLRGGSYLLLEVDFDAYQKEQLQNLMDDLRVQLRQKKIGYSGLQIRAGSIEFTLRDELQREEAENIIKAISRQFAIANDTNTWRISYGEDQLKEMKNKIVEQSLEIVRRRVDETGTREPIIQGEGDLRILLQVPGLDNPENLKQLLGKTAKMTFHLMDETNPFPSSNDGLISQDTHILNGDQHLGEESRYYAVKRKAILTGDMLINAQASFENSTPVVFFKFNNIGARKFGETTKENVGKPFAIVLDDKVISAPVIREPILGGSGMISGNFTVQSANDLALLLRTGALPAPIKILEERTVGPSLGQDSIEAGKKAALIGTALVMFFMFICYGLFGIFANLAVIINLIMIVAALSILQATLTLPGIAGMVLTVGMAVDANVLIFERMREEIKQGRSPLAVIDHGFKAAFSTIFDSNITTLIVAIILFAVGSGPVKGFAVTLTIGILASMFTAIMLTRLMIVLWVRAFKPSRIPI